MVITAQNSTESNINDETNKTEYDDDILLLRKRKEKIAKNFYITIPWSPQMYFSIRGSENFHIYRWIAKDFCWLQDFQSKPQSNN